MPDLGLPRIKMQLGPIRDGHAKLTNAPYAALLLTCSQLHDGYLQADCIVHLSVQIKMNESPPR